MLPIVPNQEEISMTSIDFLSVIINPAEFALVREKPDTQISSREL